MLKLLIIPFLFITVSYGQIKGCTDPSATNFNSRATINDCKCWYASAKVAPKFTKRISDSIPGTSGLIPMDGLLWTHNDHFDTTFYGLDLQGKIQKKINFPALKCNDWEDISQDSLYLYIGDFGNNYQGNRKDLRILRIQKESFYTSNPVIDTIAFSYSNQTNFSLNKPHKTDFDCEAFVVLEEGIYLFSKQWTKEKTSIYFLPKEPGSYVAELKKTINVDGLITGATLLPHEKGVILCGYSKLLQPFLILFYDYHDNTICSGNKRKIKLKLPFHQIEAITTEDGKLFYLTNETTVKRPFVDTPQQFHIVDLSPFLKK